MKTYRAALIGSGMILNGAHIPAIQALGGRIEIVAVCDQREDAAAFTAQKLGVPWYTDCQTMLDACSADLLVNCTSNAYHKPYTMMGFKAGLDVITEKPAILSYADARDILAAAETSGRKFFPTQTGRFTHHNLTAKKWIDQGLLGQLYFADISIIRRRDVPQWGQFHIKAHNLAGAFADMAVHNIDALLSFCGNPLLKSARASMYTKAVNNGETVLISNKESGAFDGTFIPREFSIDEMDVEEFAVGTLHFDNGMTVSFRVAWAIDLPEESSFRLVGDRGGLIMPEMRLYKTIGQSQSEICPKVFDDTSNAVPGWGHWVCYEHILDDLDGIKPYPVTSQQMLNTAAILEAVYRSAELDREVTASEIVRDA